MFALPILAFLLPGQTFGPPLSPEEMATLWEESEFDGALVQSKTFHLWNCARGIDPRLSGPRSRDLKGPKTVAVVEAWFREKLDEMRVREPDGFHLVPRASDDLTRYELSGVSRYIGWRVAAELSRLGEYPMTHYPHAQYRVLWMRDRQPAVSIRAQIGPDGLGEVHAKMGSLAGFLPAPVRLCWRSKHRSRELGLSIRQCMDAVNGDTLGLEADVVVFQHRLDGHTESLIAREGTAAHRCAMRLTRLAGAPVQRSE